LQERSFEVARELGSLLPATYRAVKLSVRHNMIEAAHRRAAEGDAEIIDYWCSREVLAQMASFAERNIKRKS
jgi:hypothetical protein